MASQIPSDEEIGLALRALDEKYKSTPTDEQIAARLKELDDNADGPQLSQGGSSVPYRIRRAASPILGPNYEQRNVGTLKDAPTTGLVPTTGEMINAPSKFFVSKMPSAQNLTDLVSAVRDPEGFVDPERELPKAGWLAKGTAGVLKGNAAALGYVASLGPVLGTLAKASPLAGRAVNLGIAADISVHLPDMLDSIEKAAEAGDTEAVAEGVTGMGLGLFFGAKSAHHSLKGIASKSPFINNLLLKKIKTDIPGPQLRELYQRVNRGEGTEAEAELVRFVNSQFESPGKAVRGGVTVTDGKPRINIPELNEYLGVKSSKTIESMGETSGRTSTGGKPVNPTEPSPEPTQPGGVRRMIGEEPVRAENAQAQAVARPVVETAPVESPVVQPVPSQPIAPQETVQVPTETPVPVAATAPIEPVVKESFTTQPPASKPIVEFEGPNGKVQATFDGYQDLTPIGKGIQPQFTVVTEGNPDLVNRGSFLSEGLAKKGYNPTSEFPTVEQWKAQPRASLAPQASTVEPLTPSPTISATGPENIRTMLQSSGATESTVKVWEEFLSQPVMQRPEFRDLQVVLKDKLQLGGMAAKGIVDELNKIVELSMSDADAETLPHEVFHLIHKLLTAKDQSQITKWRQEEIVKKYGDDAPVSLLSGNMTSQEFTESGLPIEDYYLINDSEFTAHTGSEQFTQDNFASRNTPEGKTLIQKIKEFIRGLLESVKRLFGFSPTREQFYRDILQGKRMTNPRSGETYEKRASLVKTPKEAENAEKLMQTKQQEIVEGRDQVAQVSDIVKALEKHGIAKAGPGAQNLLTYSDYVGIVTTGERLLGQKGLDYRTLKPTLTPYEVKWVSRLGVTHAGLFERKMSEVERDHAIELKKVTNKTFLKLMAKEAAAKAEADMTDLNVKISNAIFDTVIKKAQRVLRKERKSEMEIDQIKGQILEVEEAKASSVAMKQLLEDIVSVLSSTPEGVQLINDPNFGTRTDIQKVYKDIKISEGQPLHSPTLIKWAAYLIQKSKVLKDNLVAQYLAGQSSVRAGMVGYEAKLMHGLETEPAKTIKDLRREAGDMRVESNQAKFAYRTLHKRVVDGLKRFETLQEAMDVVQKIKADPDYNAVVAEMRKDDGVVGDQKPMQAFEFALDKNGKAVANVMLPSGQVLNVAPDYWIGNKTLFQQNHQTMETALGDLKQWLNDPANAKDKNYGTHERDYIKLLDYFTGLSLFQPTDPSKIHSTTLGILHEQADMIGGRLSISLRKSIRKYESMYEASRWFAQHWSNELTNSRVAALKSHNLEWSSLSPWKKSLSDVNRLWWDKVGNVLNYSHNIGRGYKIGDTLPTGWVVTKADIEGMRLQSQTSDEGIKLVKKLSAFQDQPFVEDTIGGYVVYREHSKGTEYPTPRIFDGDMPKFGGDISEAFERHGKAVQSGDVAGANKALDDLNKIYDSAWESVGHSLVSDRNADFAFATPFDGTGGGYDVLTPDVHKIQTATEFFDHLANYTGYSVAEAREISMLEWSRSISNWSKEASQVEAPETTPRAGESKNPFTRSRNKAIAPYVFYENGFKDISSLQRFASGMHSRANDELASAFAVAEQNLIRQRGELEAKVKALSLTNEPSPEKAVIKAQKLNIQNYDDYDNLDKKIIEAGIAKNSLRQIYGHEIDQIAGRYMSLVTGMLIGLSSTARNVTTGPMYSGRVANTLIQAKLTTNAVGLFYGIVRTQIPMLASGAWSALKIVVKDTPVAIYRVLTNRSNVKRGPRAVALDFMEPYLKELGEDIFNQIKAIRQMQDAGIVDRLPNVSAEMNARLMGSMLSRGMLMPKDYSFWQKFFATPLSLAEMFLLYPSTKINPKFGDYGLNASIYMMFKSSVGPFRYLEQRAKQFALDVQNGRRAFNKSNPNDPINRISYRDLWPTGTARGRAPATESDEMMARQLLERAGLDLDKFWFRFVNEALTNPNAKLLTESEENGLIETAINTENRSTVANSPHFAKSRSLGAKFLGAFFGWPTRMLWNFLNMSSIPSQSGRDSKSNSGRWSQRAKIWGLNSMLNVFGFLIIAALIGVISNQENRWIKEYVYNQVVAYRQPWERDGAKSQAMGWAIEGMNNIPIVGGVISTAINDVPVRATVDPSFVLIDKIKQGLKYAGGVMQTGDPGYKLPEFVMNMIPDARIILSRMDAFEGRSEVNNAANILRRYGPMDSMRPMGGSPTGNVATELTPYGDRMVNAAIRGDDQEFQSIYAEAVETARSIGKANPERVVREMFRSRNPYDRVFKSKLTDAERQRILQSASPEERALVEQVESRFQRASQQIGSNAAFTSEQAQSNRRSRSYGDSDTGSASAYTSMPESGGGGVPRFSQYAFRSGSGGRRRSTRLRSSGSRSRSRSRLGGTRRSSRVRMTMRTRRSGGRRRRASISLRSI